MDKYRYVFKHRETGEIAFCHFDLDEIEKGTAGYWVNGRWQIGFDLISRDRWTGLTDKNQKDIYPNDIAKHIVDFGPGGEEERISLVEITPFGINLQTWIFFDQEYLPEVIGTIYENENLLNQPAEREG